MSRQRCASRRWQGIKPSRDERKVLLSAFRSRFMQCLTHRPPPAVSLMLELIIPPPGIERPRTERASFHLVNATRPSVFFLKLLEVTVHPRAQLLHGFP